MNNNNVNGILNFIASCNEFIGGKFLFASAKLQSIYDEILQCPDSVKLFDDCNQDFNYSLEMTKAFIKMPTKVGTFTKPEELDKFLALVFGVLKELKENTLDFNIFLTKYFTGEDKVPPTQKFASLVMVPFRDTVAKYFELNENNKTRYEIQDISSEPVEEEKMEEEIKEEESETVNLLPIFEKIKEISAQMIALIKQDIRIKGAIKADLTFVLTEIVKSCDQLDIEKAYALIVGLKYMTVKIRSVKYLMQELILVLMQLETM